MATQKLRASYSGWKDGDLLLHAENVHASLTENPELKDLWPAAVPFTPELKVAIDTFREAFTAALRRDLDKIALRKANRAELVTILSTMARQLETLAVNNPHLIMKSGFDTRRPYGSNAVHVALGAPVISLKHGDFPGDITGRTPRMKGAGSFEMHSNEGDPSNEAGWKPQGVFIRASRMEMKGLEGGKVYWFRARAIGTKGVGPWSDPISLRAL